MLIMMQFRRSALKISEINEEISHDQVTRLLNHGEFKKKHFESITKPCCKRGGYLIIDDTVLEKHPQSAFEDASFVYSSSKGKAVFGYQACFLIWTDGKKRIVLDYKIYVKGGPSKIELALEMLSYARNQLKMDPEYVLFDSWYACKKILKRIAGYGWFFVTRLKKNRIFDGKKLKEYRKYPYWHAIGRIEGGLKILVVKNVNKYFATNRLSIVRTHVLNIYKSRQHIEEVNKQLKFLGLNDCQMRSIKAQNNYTVACIIAYSLLEKKSKALGTSLYKTKSLIISKKESVFKSDLERLSRAA